MNQRTIQKAAAAVLSAFLLTACQDSGFSLGSEVNATTPVADVYSPAPQQDIPVFTITSPSPDAGIPQVETLSPARVVDFQMLDDRTGFAWSDANEGLSVYRTEDGGENWLSITPAPKARGVGLPSMQFLDSRHGWAAISTEAQQIHIWYTKDGGDTWGHTELASSGYPAALSFVTPEIGWLISVYDVAMGKSGKLLHKTENGGIDWELISLSPYEGDAVGRIPAELPLHGHVVDMFFQDRQTGWLSVTGPAPIPQLYRSLDGGVTWSAALLEFPEELPQTDITIDQGPVFASGMDRTDGWIRTRRTDGMQVLYDFFRSTDNGETWTFVPAGFDHSLIFLDKDTGWGVKDDVLHKTNNGGLSWTAIPASGLSGLLDQYEVPVRLQMAADDRGWLLLGQGGGGDSGLFRTEDGGSSWEILAITD
ncbi:WD40/YVTN/BNR-like repeat-containing protein [Paenibacillus senegalensis]|uniref:WD40/YVTN/BNR-like repeat-containing protein n=1 Tax=Paenibacillus senegalensis TaxID=1465766 RepID=UPI000288270A|nr:VPS10 domain-containing receptor SorCS3 [Paenibacillus senegalensis]